MIQFNLIGIGYSEKETPYIVFPVGEVALSQDDPLSVDLTMFPSLPTPRKISFPKVTPNRFFPVGEVTLSKDDPLSVDLTMFPETPPAAKISFPKVTPLRRFAVGDVALSKDEPLSVDLKMSPLPPVATNTSGFAEEELSEVLVELSEDSSMCPVFLHEETITAMLTNMTNQFKILFIFFLNIKYCKIKTTHFYITSIRLKYKNVEVTWRVSDCEELSGGYSHDIL